MPTKSILALSLMLGSTLSCLAQEKTNMSPVELEVLKMSLGTWDAVIEVWPGGAEAPSISFKGVETNRAYGEYWIASDFDSEFEGQATRVHSIVGYDLDKKKLVGKIIDHGPYAATMTGEYDEQAKTVHWITKAKDLAGNSMTQETQVTQKNDDVRELVLMAQGEEKDELTKVMQIKYVKRKE